MLSAKVVLGTFIKSPVTPMCFINRIAVHRSCDRTVIISWYLDRSESTYETKVEERILSYYCYIFTALIAEIMFTVFVAFITVSFA